MATFRPKKFILIPNKNGIAQRRNGRQEIPGWLVLSRVLAAHERVPCGSAAHILKKQSQFSDGGNKQAFDRGSIQNEKPKPIFTPPDRAPARVQPKGSEHP